MPREAHGCMPSGSRPLRSPQRSGRGLSLHGLSEIPLYLLRRRPAACLVMATAAMAKEGRRRSRSSSPPRREKARYKGRKNILGRDGKPLKCYTCKCDHEDNCNCPCVYHLANACPNNSNNNNNNNNSNNYNNRAPDLGLFMSTNIFPDNIDDSNDLVL